MDAILETWTIAASLNEYLLNSISEKHLRDMAPSKGRNVGEQFAHLHNMRLLWLRAAQPELLNGLLKLEKDSPLSKTMLIGELNKSATAMMELLKTGLASGRIKGFKPHPQAFLGYLIAHEAHHRGQIILTLKMNAHLSDKKVLFGLWEWGSPK